MHDEGKRNRNVKNHKVQGENAGIWRKPVGYCRKHQYSMSQNVQSATLTNPVADPAGRKRMVSTPEGGKLKRGE